MLGIVEHLVGETRLDDLPAPHDEEPVREEPRDGEVVGHDDGREPEVRDEPAQEVEQPGLDRHVEAPRRLIHEDQTRAHHEVARDLEPLLHAAREGLRQVIDARSVDLHAPEPRERLVPDAPVVARAEREQPLAHVRAGRDAHAQPVGRVLVDDAPVGAREPPQRRLGQPQQVHHGPVALRELDAPAARREPTREAPEQRGLSRARFAHDPQHLARPEVEADVEAPDARAVVPGEPAHPEERGLSLHGGARRSRCRSRRTCARPCRPR